MRIAVTGATGNIGTALLRRLAGEGHQILGLARRVPDREVTPGGGEVTWQSVDLTQLGPERLRGLFDGCDAVVHLAWGFQPSHDLEYLRELGVGGTKRVVDAVRAAGVPHLVHMSSVGAYSPRESDAPVDESWPTEGVRTSRYSRHKSTAERILDDLESMADAPLVTRVRPGIVGQRSAGSALLRYGVPGLVPASLLTHLPLLPLDRGLVIPVVHSDDVADAVARILERRVGGAFNLAAERPLTAPDIADVFGARLVHVPSTVIRQVVSAGWHLRLQQLDTGWIDLAFAVPLMDCSRARTELDWEPTLDAVEVFREVLDAMASADHGDTEVLRKRTVAGTVSDAVRRGLVSQRTRP